MTDEVASRLAQSRKQGVDLLYTAQAFQGVDAIIRRLTAVVHKCERWGPLIRVRETDGTSGEYLCTHWTRLKPAVWELYDTYAIVGNSAGEGGGLGAARLRAAAVEAVKLLKRRDCLVVPRDGGPLRRARFADLVGEAELVVGGRPWRGYDRGLLMEIGRQGYAGQLLRWMAHVEHGCPVPGAPGARPGLRAS
jgi:hypothetical protein